MSATETSAPTPTVPERITIVLKAQEGSTLEQICQFVSLGMPVAIGRGIAVIAGASDEDLQMALGKERDDRFMDIERLESALEVDKHMALAAPEMANLLKRIDVKVGGLMAVAGHGMAPSEEMWDEAEGVLAEIELVLNQSQGKPYAPSHLIDEVPLEKFKDHKKNISDGPGFSIDDHIRLVADAERYRCLRDKVCIEDADNDLMVVRGDRYFDGAELDTEIDNALRLARLEELHPCAD